MTSGAERVYAPRREALDEVRFAPVTAAVVYAAMGSSPWTVRGLAECMALNPTSVRNYLNRMAGDGFVTKQKVGGTYEYRVAREWVARE